MRITLENFPWAAPKKTGVKDTGQIRGATEIRETVAYFGEKRGGNIIETKLVNGFQRTASERRRYNNRMLFQIIHNLYSSCIIFPGKTGVKPWGASIPGYRKVYRDTKEELIPRYIMNKSVLEAYSRICPSP